MILLKIMGRIAETGRILWVFFNGCENQYFISVEKTPTSASGE
jgi:hypothetical protein